MDSRTSRGVRFPALSLTTIESVLAPTEIALAIRQQPASNALDVTGFSNRRMYRMIRALTATFQHLDVAVQVTGAGQQDVSAGRLPAGASSRRR